MAPLTDTELDEWAQEDPYNSILQRRRFPLLIAEVRRLRELADAARLLGPARMVLDACATHRRGYEGEAADMAQRIVDLIGHSVTDEPPHALVERDELRRRVEELEDQLAAAVDVISAREDRSKNDWPDGHTFIRELREALGMFAGAMPIPPKQAWDEALERARGLAKGYCASCMATEQPPKDVK